MEKKTVCLNMIVKNESKVIQRCLASVKPFIDYWLIVDTGSTDGTQKLIKSALQKIPGELHERPWVNFEHNRNEALALAKPKADYSLFIDADETLAVSKSFRMPSLDKDCYRALVNSGPLSGLRMFMVRNQLDWKWQGVIHEDISAPNIMSFGDLENVIILANTKDGNRAKDPEKFLKDTQILEKALEAEPDNPRYAFYLAQTYMYAGKPAEGVKWSQRRVEMGGNEQERFWSYLMIALAQNSVEKPSVETSLDALWKAHYLQPNRAEPLYFIAHHHYTSGNLDLAYLYSKFALSFPFPQGTGYIIFQIYDFELLLLFANVTKAMGNMEESKGAYEELLKKEWLPAQAREMALKDLRSFR